MVRARIALCTPGTTRVAAAVIAVTVMLGTAGCLEVRSDPVSATEFCTKLTTGVRPEAILERDHPGPEAAEVARRFAEEQCPEQLETNGRLRAMLDEQTASRLAPFETTARGSGA